MQLNSITNKFKSHVKWTKEELDSVVQAAIARVNSGWPPGRLLTANEWETVDAVGKEIDAARNSGNMQGLRIEVDRYEQTLKTMAKDRPCEAGAGGKILF